MYTIDFQSFATKLDDVVLSQQKTSVMPQHTMLKSQKSPLSRHHNVEVSEVSIVGSQKSQFSRHHNVQVAEKPSGPKSTKMVRNGSRMVARP